MNAPTSPDLSPSQKALALAAVNRLRELLELHRAAGVAPMDGETLPVPLEELNCLCLAASVELGLDPDGFDLGAWH